MTIISLIPSVLLIWAVLGFWGIVKLNTPRWLPEWAVFVLAGPVWWGLIFATFSFNQKD